MRHETDAVAESLGWELLRSATFLLGDDPPGTSEEKKREAMERTADWLRHMASCLDEGFFPTPVKHVDEIIPLACEDGRLSRYRLLRAVRDAMQNATPVKIHW